MTNVKAIKLFSGEYSADNAPKAKLYDGSLCIPQHYLKYQHTLSSVQELVLKIDYCDRYPIFVSEDKQGIYLQVGIIGIDNYAESNYAKTNSAESNYAKSNDAENNCRVSDTSSAQRYNNRKIAKDKNLKIMYARKWRVEPKLPSAEIIQTAFLALKKAREHEVRELFRLTIANKVTTPFNNHHDITMLANSEVQLQTKEPVNTWSQLQQELDNVCYDQASFHIANIENRHDRYWLLELEVLKSPSTDLPELKAVQFLVLVLKQITFNEVCYQLMAELIRLSDRHIDEHFTFLKVARFSQQNDIKTIARISANTRALHKSLQTPDFEKNWRNDNYQVDLTRVPQLNESLFSTRIKGLLNSFSSIEGMLPNYQ